jgi:phenylacetate-CoA ligase
MTVNEDLILEIVRPGTGDPVAEGDVGEIVVTSLDLHHPLDSPGARRPHGSTSRLEQVAEIGKRHPELGRLRLVVTREAETDVMTLRAEVAAPNDQLREAVTATLRSVAKLSGGVELVSPGSLPSDGKVIADERG